jgi:hypothetical protein
MPGIPDYLGKKSSKIWTGFLERSMLFLTVNISSSLAFLRASRRCRTTRNAILRWSYTRCDNTRCASQQCAGWPLLGGRLPLFATLLRNTRCSFSKIRSFSSPKSAVLFSAICVPVLRNMRSASLRPNKSRNMFRLAAIRVLPSLQYAFRLSAKCLPPLREMPSSSPNTPSASSQDTFRLSPISQ